mmetsp:Transcript_58428/g.130223  ORF Transcript_58428/g.130223 Transcript_58428/m.130223 type:complete len:220 (+) Transcript_58428:949-1608(+)
MSGQSRRRRSSSEQRLSSTRSVPRSRQHPRARKRGTRQRRRADTRMQRRVSARRSLSGTVSSYVREDSRPLSSSPGWRASCARSRHGVGFWLQTSRRRGSSWLRSRRSRRTRRCATSSGVRRDCGTSSTQRVQRSRSCRRACSSSQRCHSVSAARSRHRPRGHCSRCAHVTLPTLLSRRAPSSTCAGSSTRATARSRVLPPPTPWSSACTTVEGIPAVW